VKGWKYMYHIFVPSVINICMEVLYDKVLNKHTTLTKENILKLL